MSAARILVTGGAGYIGSHTCKALSASGFEPVAFDNLSTGHRDAVRYGPFVHGDILDGDAVTAALSAHRIDAVVHFAARAYVGESVTDPASYYRTNVAGTLALLNASRRCGVRRFVFSSSCATYGIPDRLPIVETTMQQPINPYGRTKLFAEAMLADEAAAYGLRYVALRYFNAAGADPNRKLGERHDPETHLVPLAIFAAMGRSRALTVFGDDYDTADGTCVRDYIHVSDLARAHVLALQHLLDGGESLALNLGSGQGTSILDVTATVRRVLNRPVPIEIHARRPGDPPALYADIARSRERLGFVPELSDIETIIATAARFHALEAAS